jgi:hypothetical protein
MAQAFPLVMQPLLQLAGTSDIPAYLSPSARESRAADFKYGCPFFDLVDQRLLQEDLASESLSH